MTSLRIRGAESDQTVALIDGVKLNDPSAPGGGFNFADLLTDNLDRIEVLIAEMLRSPRLEAASLDEVRTQALNALQAQHQFTPGTNLKAWLFTILRNRFRSLIARKHVTLMNDRIPTFLDINFI